MSTSGNGFYRKWGGKIGCCRNARIPLNRFSRIEFFFTAIISRISLKLSQMQICQHLPYSARWPTIALKYFMFTGIVDVYTH